MKGWRSVSKAHSSNKKGGSFGGDWHVSHSSMGMGDYYGTGVKQKVGRIREGYGQNPVSPENLKKPPKSLA